MEEQSKNLTTAVQQQQGYLESVDTERRRNNLIMTGIPEDPTPISIEGAEPAITDTEKIAQVMEKLGHADKGIQQTIRLGQLQTGVNARPRPVKIILKKCEDRKDILRSTKLLKNAGPQYDKVYVSRDSHPAIRKENKRLREVTQEEKERPENQGRTVEYDWKQRCVTVDGIIVDTFKPHFF